MNEWCLHFSLTDVGFQPLSYTVTEGVDSFVRLTLFRTGSTDIPALVNITTLFDTATGEKSEQVVTFNECLYIELSWSTKMYIVLNNV